MRVTFLTHIFRVEKNQRTGRRSLHLASKKVVNKKGNWSRGREARKGIKLKVMGEVFRESAQLGLSKTPVRGNPFQKKGNHCCNDTELIE